MHGSYLSDRSQRFSLDSKVSDIFQLTHGVPQGSCLGPLLFTLHVSKLFDIVKGHLPGVHTYAENTQLYLAFKPDSAVNALDAVNAMEPCIRDLRTLMLHDKLKLNDDKTEFILIETRQQLAKIDGISLCVGDSNVSAVKSTKNLGTWINSNLNLKINAYYHLTNVRRIRKYLDEKSSQTLIHALVIGRIDYYNSILYGLQARELTKLQRLQNSATRIIFVLSQRYVISHQFCVNSTSYLFSLEYSELMDMVQSIYKSLQQNGAYNLGSSNKGLMLQAPNA